MGSLRDTQPISHSNSPLIMTLFVVLDITILSLILFLFFFFKKKNSYLFLAWVGFYIFTCRNMNWDMG